MSDDPQLPDPSPPPEADPSPPPEAEPTPPSTAPDEAQILELARRGWGTRKIADALGLSRKRVRRTLQAAGLLRPTQLSLLPPPARASKLDPFREEIKEKVGRGFTTTRILRELKERGYTGGRSILATHVRQLRAPLAPRKKVTRRFETEAGRELQIDWSVYRIPVAGRLVTFHAFVAVLGHSRRAFVVFFESERRARLLEGCVLAFEYFEGACAETVVDNMATAVIGRVRGREVLWDPSYLALCEHYGTRPFACRVRHPDRKGIVEAFIGFLEKDFVRGLELERREELNPLVRRWLDEIANRRVHGTTGLVPDEAWQQEKPFLIALPERRFPGACEEEVRQVAEDATVSVSGVAYSVPAQLAHKTVTVRLYAEHFEVLGLDGAIALSARYLAPEERRRLVIDPAHYASLPGQPRDPKRPQGRRLKDRFLERWPDLEEYVAGLTRRVSSLVHVHLAQLVRLSEAYGEGVFLDAVTRAHAAGLHTAGAVRRILEREQPDPIEDPQPTSGAEARALALLGDVDPGSLADLGALDEAEPTPPADRTGGEEGAA